MNRRKLVVLGGIGLAVAVITAITLRRKRRLDETDIEITEVEKHDQPTVNEASAGDLESLEGVGPAYAERLQEAGVRNVADLPDVDAGDLARETGIAEGRIRDWAEQASDRVGA